MVSRGVEGCRVGRVGMGCRGVELVSSWCRGLVSRCRGQGSVADGAGAQAPATVVPPGMRSGPWNSYDKAQLEDAVGVARLFGASCVRVIRPGYATIEVDLKHEKAAGDRESVKAAERSYIERTAPKKNRSSQMSSLRQRPRLARPRRTGRRSAGRRRLASARPRARPSARSARARSYARTSST